jgi:tryptophan-rich sensory protein
MKKSTLALTLWIVLSLSVGWIGSNFPPGDWYASLAKPAWNPPGYVFGPVWTALYLLMGVAAWMVWRKEGFSGAPVALGLFLFQLALNALWSYLFFGLQRPGCALVEVIILWLAILATTLRFWRISSAAGVLMLPYLLWVGFATVLNLQLWRLNS